jgi:glycine/D-amino acid oxidase-like deaminating enzyme
MARKLDLRSGRPVWSAYRAPAVPVKASPRSARCDVLIVGMGVGGAMAAESLTAEGLDVLMIDRRGPLKGSTAATTALVQYEIDQPLTLLSKQIGRQAAIAGWRRSRLGLVNLEARIRDLGLDCRMTPRPSLYLAGNVLTPRALEAEAAARREAAIPAHFLKPAAMRETYGIDRAAIRSQGNLALDPERLTAGLLLKALERGARLHAPAEAVDLAHHGDSVEVGLADGATVTAGRVVLATGYELVDIVPRDRHRIISTWAIATKPQKRALWPQQAMLWEASDPYLYARALPDGRVVCGGEDEDFQDEEQRDSLTAAKTARIAAKLKTLLPRLDTTPDFAWAGAFGTTATGLPLIGPLPHRPRIFAVMGYGGNGITYAQIASEMIRNWAAGRSDPDAELFGF